MSVAEFYTNLMGALVRLETLVSIFDVPNELPDATPIPHDTALRPYDPMWTHRFLASTVAGGLNFQNIPHRISRQGKSGSLLLGRF